MRRTTIFTKSSKHSISLWVVAILATGCGNIVDLDNLTGGSQGLEECATDGGTNCDAGVDAGVDMEVRFTPVPWVDPKRCVSPCTHPDETHLVAIDTYGQASSVATFLKLDGEAQPYAKAFLDAAWAQGYAVTISSSYRSYSDQVSTYKTTTAGRAARPGHSEHELGLAIDLSFPDAAKDWLFQHAHEHGFVLSFPAHKEKITGYAGEPWHYRYVGQAMAQDMYAAGQSPEEYFLDHPDRTSSGDCSDCTDLASTGDCTGVTSDGTCDGTVVRWCFQASISDAVDCSVFSSTCANGGTGLGAYCQ